MAAADRAAPAEVAKAAMVMVSALAHALQTVAGSSAAQMAAADRAAPAQVAKAATRAVNARGVKGLAWAMSALQTAIAAKAIHTAQEVYALVDTARKSV
jgi:hypothetical protein